MDLKKGMKAPDFTLKDEAGKEHKLSSYKGQKVVLYFYPKDNTPGCTTQACSFRDDYEAYKDLGVAVIGVSPDSEKSHAKFKEGKSLPFTLLSDPEHKVIEQYGSWGRKKMMGREYDGVLRNTFLIDEKGKILEIYEKVKPAENSKEILQRLAE